MSKVLLLFAVIPGLFLIYYAYKLDRIEKEPKSLLVKLFIFGALTIPVAIILERVSLNALANILYGGGILYIFFENLFVGIIEEGVKMIALLLGSWRNKNFNYLFDGIVYAVMVSLGFAVVENIMYGVSYGFSTVLLRAVTSIPYHAIFSLFMGEYYGLAKMAAVSNNSAGASKNMILAYMVPVLVHTLYDFGASIPGVGIVFFLVIFFFEYLCFKKVKKLALMDKPL
ncbi:MAG: PrsW family intramembrane metalloprotease [Firmicutes bacterium]|nr:PrsW family intramembrane metalloprotease [Bacillota bacterium]